MGCAEKDILIYLKQLQLGIIIERYEANNNIIIGYATHLSLFGMKYSEFTEQKEFMSNILSSRR